VDFRAKPHKSDNGGEDKPFKQKKRGHAIYLPLEWGDTGKHDADIGVAGLKEEGKIEDSGPRKGGEDKKSKSRTGDKLTPGCADTSLRRGGRKKHARREEQR